jgi:hypothetical protein
MNNVKGSPTQTQRDSQEAPTDQTGKHQDDAREEPGKQRRNREEMGVNEDHKTNDMEEGGRGTFP